MGWFVDLIDRIVMGKPKPVAPLPRLTKDEEDEIMREFLENQEKHYYCKCCGNITYAPFSIQDFYRHLCKIKDDKVIYPICYDCDSKDSFVYSKHTIGYYYERAEEVFGSKLRNLDVLFEEEIETNPDFDREKFKLHCQKEAEYKARNERKRIEAYMNLNYDTTPRCPTCQSSSIERISTTKKVVGAATLGYYSKNAMCQFVCNNCGYKW